LSLKNLTGESNKIIFNVVEPDKENGVIGEVIVLAGGQVKTVNVLGSTVKDVY
jgi:hypothetical protein